MNSINDVFVFLHRTTATYAISSGREMKDEGWETESTHSKFDQYPTYSDKLRLVA
jgi:hypothetical protein